MTDHTPADEITDDTDPGTGPAAQEPGADPVPSDWNPRGPRVRRDAVAAYDELRSRCPVARGPSASAPSADRWGSP